MITMTAIELIDADSCELAELNHRVQHTHVWRSVFVVDSLCIRQWKIWLLKNARGIFKFVFWLDTIASVHSLPTIMKLPINFTNCVCIIVVRQAASVFLA